MLRVAVILLLPFLLSGQNDLSASLGLGLNFTNYSLSDNLGQNFTFESSANTSFFAFADYGVHENILIRGRVAYLKYGLEAFDSVGVNLVPVENSIKYIESAVHVIYRTKADHGFYLGAGPSVSWVLGKENASFDQIVESDLNNLYSLEIIIGFLLRQEKLNFGIEGFMTFPFNSAMETTIAERIINLKTDRIAGLRVFVNFGLNR